MHADSRTHESLLSELEMMQRQLTTLQDMADAHLQAETTLAEKTRLLALSAEIGTALAGSDSLRTMLQRCTEAMVEHVNAALACIWTIEEDSQMLEMQASAGLYFHLEGPDGHVPIDHSEVGFIAQERRPYVTQNLLDDVKIQDKAWD